MKLFVSTILVCFALAECAVRSLDLDSPSTGTHRAQSPKPAWGRSKLPAALQQNKPPARRLPLDDLDSSDEDEDSNDLDDVYEYDNEKIDQKLDKLLGARTWTTGPRPPFSVAHSTFPPRPFTDSENFRRPQQQQWRLLRGSPPPRVRIPAVPVLQNPHLGGPYRPPLPFPNERQPTWVRRFLVRPDDSSEERRPLRGSQQAPVRIQFLPRYVRPAGPYRPPFPLPGRREEPTWVRRFDATTPDYSEFSDDSSEEIQVHDRQPKDSPQIIGMPANPSDDFLRRQRELQQQQGGHRVIFFRLKNWVFGDCNKTGDDEEDQVDQPTPEPAYQLRWRALRSHWFWIVLAFFVLLVLLMTTCVAFRVTARKRSQIRYRHLQPEPIDDKLVVKKKEGDNMCTV